MSFISEQIAAALLIAAFAGGLIGFVFGKARGLGDLIAAQAEAERASDLVGKYQAKQPVRDLRGRFVGRGK